MECWLGLSEQHALTRSVRDSARLLDATHGAPAGAAYRAAPPPRPFADEVGAPPGRLRIAFCTGAACSTSGPSTPSAWPRSRRPPACARSWAMRSPRPGPRWTSRPSSMPSSPLPVARAPSRSPRAERLTGRKVRPGDVELTTWIIRIIGRKRSAADLDQAFDVMRHTGRVMAGFMEQLRRRADLHSGAAVLAHRRHGPQRRPSGPCSRWWSGPPAPVLDARWSSNWPGRSCGRCPTPTSATSPGSRRCRCRCTGLPPGCPSGCSSSAGWRRRACSSAWRRSWRRPAPGGTGGRAR